jgi:ribosomal protein S20
MLVQVKNLQPNPYRDMEHYPIDKDKIQSLKDSIEQTEFWDNILARPKPDHSSIEYEDLFIERPNDPDGYWDSKEVLVGPEIDNIDDCPDNVISIMNKAENGYIYYDQPICEIAYGHHRLQALQELGIEEVDIPIKFLDDATMIQIMANENMEQWKMNPSVINETVKVARDFLNTELSKYESWEDVCGDKSIITKLVQDAKGWVKLRDQKAGRESILKFLGKGWKQWMIQEALDTLNDTEIDQKAIETFKSPSVAREFKKVVRNINKENPQKITKEETIELAEKVQKRISDNKGKGLGEKSYASTMKTIVRQEVEEVEVEEVDEFTATLKDLTLEIESITSRTKDLKNKIASFNGRLLEMGVTDLKGIQSLFIVNEFSLLLESINTMGNYFGVQFNKLKK